MPHTFNGLLGLGVNDAAPVVPFHCLDQVQAALLGIWGLPCSRATALDQFPSRGHLRL